VEAAFFAGVLLVAIVVDAPGHGGAVVFAGIVDEYEPCALCEGHGEVTHVTAVIDLEEGADVVLVVTEEGIEGDLDAGIGFVVPVDLEGEVGDVANIEVSYLGGAFEIGEEKLGTFWDFDGLVFDMGLEAAAGDLI